jgi:hypothetical protein
LQTLHFCAFTGSYFPLNLAESIYGISKTRSNINPIKLIKLFVIIVFGQQLRKIRAINFDCFEVSKQLSERKDDETSLRKIWLFENTRTAILLAVTLQTLFVLSSSCQLQAFANCS